MATFSGKEIKRARPGAEHYLPPEFAYISKSGMTRGRNNIAEQTAEMFMHSQSSMKKGEPSVLERIARLYNRKSPKSDPELRDAQVVRRRSLPKTQEKDGELKLSNSVAREKGFGPSAIIKKHSLSKLIAATGQPLTDQIIQELQVTRNESTMALQRVDAQKRVRRAKETRVRWVKYKNSTIIPQKEVVKGMFPLISNADVNLKPEKIVRTSAMNTIESHKPGIQRLIELDLVAKLQSGMSTKTRAQLMNVKLGKNGLRTLLSREELKQLGRGADADAHTVEVDLDLFSLH